MFEDFVSFIDSWHGVFFYEDQRRSVLRRTANQTGSKSRKLFGTRVIRNKPREKKLSLMVSNNFFSSSTYDLLQNKTRNNYSKRRNTIVNDAQTSKSIQGRFASYKSPPCLARGWVFAAVSNGNLYSPLLFLLTSSQTKVEIHTPIGIHNPVLFKNKFDFYNKKLNLNLRMEDYVELY